MAPTYCLRPLSWWSPLRKLFWKYFLIPFSPQGEPVHNQHVLGAGAGGQGDDGAHQGDDHHGVHDHHDLISVTPTLLFPYIILPH